MGAYQVLAFPLNTQVHLIWRTLSPVISNEGLILTPTVTSVCTGSMILAAAGLLQGYKAACHWAFRDQLAMLGVEVVPQRVVIDRDRITGAGVTSGIDFGLTLLGLLCGEQVAKMAQLMMEYMPEPPFNAGAPETAGEEIVQPLMQFGRLLLDAFLTQTKDSASQLKLRT